MCTFQDMFQSITQCVLEIMDRGVVHRDIKCENILVQECPLSLYCFRIVEFGCASELEVRYNGFFPDYHDFLDSCLNFHWFERPSLQNLLSHPWFSPPHQEIKTGSETVVPISSQPMPARPAS